MTELDFQRCIDNLTRQCSIAPSKDDVAARLPEMWKDMQRLPVERLQRAITRLIRQPEFRFFPTVGELLNAVNQADMDSGEAWLGLSPVRDDDVSQAARMANDPKYREEQKRISEEAAKVYFASPEHQELMRTMAALAMAEKKTVPPGVPPGIEMKGPTPPWAKKKRSSRRKKP